MSSTKNIQYSAEVPNSPDIPGEGKPRRGIDYLEQPLMTSYDPAVVSLHDNFNNGVKISGNNPCFGKRPIVNGVAGPFVWQSYNEVAARRNNIASALVKNGIKTKDNVGLYSINRMEWVIAEYACYRQNFCTVTLYDTLGDEAIEFICNQSQLTICFASKEKVAILLRLKSKLKYLKTIVCMDDVTDDLKKSGVSASVEIVSFEEFEKIGAANPAPENPPGAADVATICYTSGTTGLPKGVVLTHGNIVSDISSIKDILKNVSTVSINADSVVLSYLPLAHVFERVACNTFIGAGARVGFFQGDTLKLLDDLAELRPTLFVSVPRLFNRIYDKVLAGVKAKGGLAQTLFNTGFESKKKGLKNGNLTHWLWDTLVFNKVKARLGGRVQAIITGSAPLSAEVMEFLRICFGVEVFEGYGQTETSAGASLTRAGDYSIGHVGAPLAVNEIKLVDVPEMGYTSQDKPYPRGEICFKGNNCFREYYKDPAKTAETIDKDGWLHSGDVGMWNDNGNLVIIDRKKHIFKLAQGEYIAPEKVETLLMKSSGVSQLFIHGESIKSSLVAIVVPDEEATKAWGAKNNMANAAVKDIATSDAFRSSMLSELQTFGKANGLKGFELPRAIYIETTPFSIENDLLTPSFKVKRHDVRKRYADKFTELYKGIPE